MTTSAAILHNATEKSLVRWTSRARQLASPGALTVGNRRTLRKERSLSLRHALLRAHATSRSSTRVATGTWMRGSTGQRGFLHAVKNARRAEIRPQGRRPRGVTKAVVRAGEKYLQHSRNRHQRGVRRTVAKTLNRKRAEVDPLREECEVNPDELTPREALEILYAEED